MLPDADAGWVEGRVPLEVAFAPSEGDASTRFIGFEGDGVSSEDMTVKGVDAFEGMLRFGVEMAGSTSSV